MRPTPARDLSSVERELAEADPPPQGDGGRSTARQRRGEPASGAALLTRPRSAHSVQHPPAPVIGAIAQALPRFRFSVTYGH